MGKAKQRRRKPSMVCWLHSGVNLYHDSPVSLTLHSSPAPLWLFQQGHEEIPSNLGSGSTLYAQAKKVSHVKGARESACGGLVSSSWTSPRPHSAVCRLSHLVPGVGQHQRSEPAHIYVKTYSL